MSKNLVILKNKMMKHLVMILTTLKLNDKIPLNPVVYQLQTMNQMIEKSIFQREMNVF